MLDFVISSGPFHSLGDLFDGQLASLSPNPPGNPAIGGQNFGHCCRIAVNESLEIINGYLKFLEVKLRYMEMLRLSWQINSHAQPRTMYRQEISPKSLSHILGVVAIAMAGRKRVPKSKAIGSSHWLDIFCRLSCSASRSLAVERS